MHRLASFLIFFAIALSLLVGMHYYVWARFVRDPQLPTLAARIATTLVIALGLAMPLTLVVSRFFPTGPVRPALWLTFAWMGVGFLLVAFLGFADAARLLAWVFTRVVRDDPPADPQRRVLLARSLAAGVGGVVAGLSAFGARSALGSVQVKDVTVRLRNLPRELAGLRLVQISDLHVGPLLQKDWVEHVSATVRSLSPDVVAITGDLVDGSVAELREHVAPLARLGARYGTFFSTGNHEYYSGVEEWVAYLPTLGIRPLINERVELAPGLDLAGIEDPTGAPNLQATLAGRNEAKPVILMAHQPRQFREAVRRGVDLTLSGHTHGGLLAINRNISAGNLLFRYISGIYTRGRSKLLVSNGTGNWFPLRVNAPAEIIEITLTGSRALPL